MDLPPVRTIPSAPQHARNSPARPSSLPNSSEIAAPIPLFLCEVRYTLPERSAQIFTSRYALYLSSEEKLAAELQRNDFACYLSI
jgi:hypothetical protein